MATTSLQRQVRWAGNRLIVRMGSSATEPIGSVRLVVHTETYYNRKLDNLPGTLRKNVESKISTTVPTQCSIDSGSTPALYV